MIYLHISVQFKVYVLLYKMVFIVFPKQSESVILFQYVFKTIS